MLYGHKIIVVMPAYNAAQTLERTLSEVPREYVDDVILVDDGSTDSTVGEALKLGLTPIVHQKNRGYGGNQKTCYRAALDQGADIVVMLHPDYQYSPKLILALAGIVASGHYDIALGSRIVGGGTLNGGMPLYKYVANRWLTLVQNFLTGAKLSEYHTGFRAFSAKVLQELPLEENSDDFVFDNQMLVQALWFKFRIGEVSCPTRYMPEASSIGFLRSVRYGFGVLLVTCRYFLARCGLPRPGYLKSDGRRLGEVHR